MYFYHGNKHYYLTRIFLNDEELKSVLQPLNLSNNRYESLCYSLGEGLVDPVDAFTKNSDLSATEFYDSERKNYLNDNTYNSILLNTIQSVLNNVTNRSYPWYLPTNEYIYIGILKSVLYGSIRHFFYEHRELYIPQYDWYLINQNPKRKEIIDALFREFDKLSTIADAIRYYQDPDDIPVEFLIRLQEITGLTMSTYNGIFSAEQLRNLAKHLVLVWREKGSLFSIELFFACMGIDCSVQELWFDRRLYNNTGDFNPYTKVNTSRNFGYYLTPKTPQNTSYSYSDENVDYSMYSAPRPSRVWDYKIQTTTSKPTDEVITDLLGYTGNEEMTYEFFKSNYLLVDFTYFDKEDNITKDEIAIFKELINYMLPVYMRTLYTSDYGAQTGADDWDVIHSIDINYAGEPLPDSASGANKIFVEDFRLFDTQNISEPYYFGPKDGYIPASGASSVAAYITDFYPPQYVGERFVSGTYSIFHDVRFETFINDNDYVNKSSSGQAVDNWRIAATSGTYDMIGGTADSSNQAYPVFYDNDGHIYYPGTSSSALIREDKNVLKDDESNTEGTLSSSVEIDTNSGIPYPDDASSADYEKTITRYFFQDNSSGASSVEIYPVLFAEDNNGGKVIFSQGEIYYSEVENPIASELNTYYELVGSKFVKTKDTTIKAYKKYFVPDNSDELFNINIEPEISFIDKEIFDPTYTAEPQNLFESSSWKENIPAINDLYNAGSFIGDIQYEYYEYSNPIQNVEADLKSPITITLI